MTPATAPAEPSTVEPIIGPSPTLLEDGWSPHRLLTLPIRSPPNEAPAANYDRSMASVFTKIIDGELPGRFVWKDDRCVAFLSINPLNDGHTLVVPREEVDHWVDADPDLFGHLSVVARVIGEAQQRCFGFERIGLMIAGLEVPHLHIHVVPMAGMHSLDFANADPDPDPERLDANADRIRRALMEMGRSEVAG